MNIIVLSLTIFISANTFNLKIANPLSQSYFGKKDYWEKDKYHSTDTNKINTLDSASIKILEQVLYKDQHFREILVRLQTSNVRNMDSIILVSDTISKYDSLNLKIIEDIIAKFKKWPGVNDVGEKGNHTIFMIIQHAPTTTQEKYLSIFKESVNTGNTPKFYYPYLIDRILINSRKKQLFGTQVEYNSVTRKYFPLSLKNKSKVDKLRKKYDLPTLTDYLNALNNERQ